MMKTLTQAIITSVKSCLLTLLFALFFGAVSFAQDVSYSQFFNNLMYYNPAFAGNDLGMRVKLNYRNQWTNLSNSYDNYMFTIDIAERNIPGAGGIGLIVQSDFDGIGYVKTNSATLANAVRVPVGNNIFTQFGLSVSYVEKSIDWNRFVFSDQILLDPAVGIRYKGQSEFVQPDFNIVRYPDFGFGMLIQYFERSRSVDHIVGTIAASMQHAFQPDISFTGNGAKLPYKFVFTGNLLLDNDSPRTRRRSNNDFYYKLNPGFLYEQQGDFSSFMVGTNAYKNFVYAGLWLRSQSFTYQRVNDLIFLAGLYVPVGETSRLKLMYSYDYVISEIRRSVGTTHEISLIFELDGFSIFGEADTGRRSGGAGSTGRNRASIDCYECSPF